jgi:hypothetical protein
MRATSSWDREVRMVEEHGRRARALYFTFSQPGRGWRRLETTVCFSNFRRFSA